jgi:type II secretory pathway component PulF
VFDALTMGSSRQLTIMAAYVRRLAELLKTGLSLPTALRVAGQASERTWLRDEAAALAHRFEHNPTQDDRAAWTSRLPASVADALHAGPDGEPNVRLLQEMAEIYSERVHYRLNWSSAFLSQLAILVVGFAALVVVLALLLPWVSLINNLSG